MKKKDFRRLTRKELIDIIYDLQDALSEQQIEGAESEITINQILAEREKMQYRSRYWRTLRSTISVLIVIASLTVLLSVLFMPCLRIYGSSMTPTIQEGQTVLAVKQHDFSQGDIVAFYYNNKILVKRIIAVAGDWVNLDQDGNVYVNNSVLEEPYISEKALGECSIELPYQVPEGRYFVLGDHRETSVDSRNAAIGCVSKEQLVGKIKLVLWPFNDIRVIP